jgi:Leucine-rich repeat (LRR) protein
LSNIPDTIGNLKNLEELDLRNNDFMIIPIIIWKLKNVREHFLKLDGNPFNVQSSRILGRDVKYIREFLKKKAELSEIF